MAKTYTAAGSATAGDVYTASAHNVIVTDVNNFIVPPACSVTRTGQALANGAAFAFNSAATFDTEAPSDPMHSTTVNNTRITIRTTGLYVVTGAITLGLSAVGTLRGVTIQFDNSAFFTQHVPSSNSYNLSATVTTIRSITAGSYVELKVSQDTGGNLTCDGTLSVAWIGRTS